MSSYNNQIDPHHQHHRYLLDPDGRREQLNLGNVEGDHSYLDYKMAMDSKSSSGATGAFNGIFDTPGATTNDQSLSLLPNSSQHQNHTNPHHPQQQQQQQQESANNSSFTDQNISGSSNDRFNLSTANITNPSLNSFFQLPFELQIQQFPLTNPPLFDFQQPYYQALLSQGNEPNLINNNEPFTDLRNQSFTNLLQSPGLFGKGQFSPRLQPQLQPGLNHQPSQYHGYNGAQPTLRRRISISNGQIGQLVQFTQQQIQLLNPVYTPEAVLAATAALIEQNASLTALQPSQQTQTMPTPENSSPDKLPVPELKLTNKGESSIVPQDPHPQQSGGTTQHEDTLSSPTSNHPSGLTTNANGVPQHRLIYNNEVIFNPNNGPIPGTSAWKKQKLLERNRIAASKCRQRKKQQQQRLEQDIGKYVRDNNNLALKLKIMENKLIKFSKIMEVHFQKCHSGDNPFPLLKELINDTEEEFAKVKLEDGATEEGMGIDQNESDESLNSSTDKIQQAKISQYNF